MFLRVLAVTGLLFSVFAAPVHAAEEARAPSLYNMTKQPEAETKAQAKSEAAAKPPTNPLVTDSKPTIPSLIPPPPRGMKTITSGSPKPPEPDAATKAKMEEVKRVAKIEHEQRAAKINAERVKDEQERLEVMKATFEAAAKADEADMAATAGGQAAQPAPAASSAAPAAAPTTTATPDAEKPSQVIFNPPKKDNSGKPPRLFNVQ